MKRKLLVLLILIFYCPFGAKGQGNLKLWYDEPAETWTEALPVGNGRMGAMVFGRVETEWIQLNEESLWAGMPIDNNNPQALSHLKQIQQLLLDEKNLKARELANKYLLGTPPRIRSYQPLGDLILTFERSLGEVKEYKRALDLSEGISSVRYKIGKTEYYREVFASAPDNVIVIHLGSTEKSAVNVTIGLSRSQDAGVTAVEGNMLVMDGQIIDEPDLLRGPGGRHMKFAARVLAINEGGSVQIESSQLQVRDANSLTILLTGATDYNVDLLNFDRSIDPGKLCRTILERAKTYSYKQLRSRHITDHRELFDRVELTLGDSRNISTDLPTDERLRRIKEGGADPGLIELYFQYGRYLLMASSRAPGILPANLQGIWNQEMEAPWNSDYHTNINLQMNYWPAETTNLSETVLPLTGFFENLMTPGRRTARKMYGADGWTLHHLTDPFGRTGIMDGIQWGTFPMAGPWMSLLFWHHYEFTQDEVYLKQRAYPIMKGAARFVLDFLIEGENGYLVTAPSNSPENTFFLPHSGEKVRLTYASTMDIQIITELFNSCIKAAKIVEDNPDFVTRLKYTLEKLPPIQIGKDGTIQEWIKDYEEADPGHRHISHLFGLYPGTQITPSTSKLFEAAQKTIEKRLVNGGGHTGWSRAWIINFYARLQDGEAAYANLLALLKKSTLENLFDTHPPFQIDGNFGGTAGIAEMLLQSHIGEIYVLPALPNAWSKGHVKGLKARGNFEVEIQWEDHKLIKLKVISGSGGRCRIRYRDEVKELETKAGKTYLFDGNLHQI